MLTADHARSCQPTAPAVISVLCLGIKAPHGNKCPAERQCELVLTKSELCFALYMQESMDFHPPLAQPLDKKKNDTDATQCGTGGR